MAVKFDVYALIERASKRMTKRAYGEQADWCESYGEPGYSDPKNGIIFANWNNVPEHIQRGLERRGFELEWSDEWIIDYDANKAYRSSPDSYGWTPSYFIKDSGKIVGKADYDLQDLADYLMNDPSRADTFDADFSDLGFEKGSDDFESGFHPGQTDKPEKIFADLHAKGYDVVFQIDRVGQFDMRFNVWTRSHESEGE